MENAAATAITEAGGKITRKNNLLCARFNENSLGFWIDIIILIEALTEIVKEDSSDLYGYSVVLRKDSENIPEPLCRFFAGDRKGGGIFLDKTTAEELRSFVTFYKEGKTDGETKYGQEIFYRVKDIKIFVPTANTNFFLRDKILTPLGKGGKDSIHSALVIGKSLEGKRYDLYRNGESLPSLFIRFGNGGLNAVTDSWTEQLQILAYSKELDIKQNKADEISSAWKFLFRQRLMNTPSLFAIKTADRFFKLLIDLYADISEYAGTIPEIILENLHIAEEEAAKVIITSLSGRKEFRLLGICPEDIDTDEATASLQKWRPLFPKFLKAEGDSAATEMQDIPADIWEIGYACHLFGKYFPADLFPLLFEESGKSSVMISRSLSFLYALKIVDTLYDPCPWKEDFDIQAEAALGERKEKVRSLVRDRLLAWVGYKRLTPCLRLIEALTELGGADNIDDSLVLESIFREPPDSDASAEQARRIILSAVGAERTKIFDFILDTLKILQSGDTKKIRAAASAPAPDCEAFPVLKAQILINQSVFSLGLRDNNSAMEAIKKVTQICQKTEAAKLASQSAHSHRLFALASLSQMRIRETINYIGFALENAEKTINPQDIGPAAYYSSVIQFLYGNLSLSKMLAKKAFVNFLEGGNPEWADRTRFLEGRLLFETGSYMQAQELFNDIINNPSGEMFAEKQNMLTAWAYRSGIHCGQNTALLPSGTGFDAELFNLEALCLSGDGKSAAALASKLANLPAHDIFYVLEQPDWSSGFAQCDFLCISQKEFYERTIGAYRALAISQHHPSNNEAIRMMQQVLRAGVFPDADISDILLHYILFRVLQNSGASQVDINTAVSIAFKRLQSRAIRIDDSETRRLYFSQPHCNKALVQAAKDFKLI